MIITYSEYRYMGGALSESEFRRAEAAAEKAVRLYTFGRISNADITDDVKQLIFELIFVETEAFDNIPQSESVGNWSRSYAPKTDGDRAGKRQSLIEKYLFGALDKDGNTLIYRG